ncbi:MAG: hypothetical protein ACOZHQ_12765 [Thermodesulfobacteriota bacterium]
MPDKMWMLDNEELELLVKYSKNHVLDECDEAVVYRLVGLGLMALGFVEEKVHVINESVRLTPLGWRTLKRERVLRSPLWGPIYRVAALVF